MDMIYDIELDPVYQEGIEHGKKIAKEKAEKRGEKKGQKNKAQAIARAMKQAGEPTDKIAAYTQLSAAEIEKL